MMNILAYSGLLVGAMLLLNIPIGILYVGMLIGYRWAKESVAANGGFVDMVNSRLEADLQRHHRKAWKRELCFVLLRAAIGVALVYWAVTR